MWLILLKKYNMEISIQDLKFQLKEINKQLDKLLLLGSNDEKLVEKKIFLLQQIINIKNKKNEN